MYNLLTKSLGEGTCEVVMNISQGSISDDDNANVNQIKQSSDWIKWNDLGLKISKEDFRRWQQIDANSSNQEQLLDKYKDSNNKLKILIVTSKLLTGFDAPICY